MTSRVRAHDAETSVADIVNSLHWEEYGENMLALFRKGMGYFRPPRRMTMSEWAETEYVHDSGKLKLIPFQKGFLDAFTDPSVERITWQKSARVGATMSMTIACCYYPAQDPCRVGYLLATDDDAKGISTDEISPALERTPSCSKHFLRGGTALRNTLTHKVYPGGSLKLLAAKSPRNLRRHNMDVVLLDEVDSYQITSEGNPIDLFIRRTQNSARRKIVLASTPTHAETSEICRSFATSDQRYYFVPCPHCGAHQTLSWDKVTVNGVPVTKLRLVDYEEIQEPVAAIQCKECSETIDETAKKWMLAEGEWRATKPFTNHAGFFINTLYSPFPNASWQKLVVEYLVAKKSPDTLQTFVNTVLGEAWSDNLDDLDPHLIAKRRGAYGLHMVPKDILLITVGVDVQKDRAELTYVGWGEGPTRILGHEKVYGDPTSQQLWDAVDAAKARRFPHELGGDIGVSATAVDSGNWTQHVYAYCAGKEVQGVYAIKGVPGARPLWSESKIRPGRGAKLYNVGVDTAKTIIMQRLGVTDPEAEGYIEFTESIDETTGYFEELLGEYRKVEYKNNRPVFVWERKQGQRVEALDCLVYAFAARHTIKPNWDRLREACTAEERRVKKSSGFADLGRKLSGGDRRGQN